MALLNLTLPSIGQPNSTEDVDVVNAFSAVQTVINGNIDGANAPTLETAFSLWKPLIFGGGAIPTQGAGVTALMSGGATVSAASANIAAAGAAGTAGWAFKLDPARLAAASRTTKMQIRYELITNTVAPAQNFVPGLYPVATWDGGSGVAPTIASAGAVVTGSTASFATPAAVTPVEATSSEINFPAVGYYVFGVVVGGGMAAGSQVTVKAFLEYRQV